MKRLRIFITGSSGFIGSHLWDYFEKQGHEIKGVDNFMHSCKHPQNKRSHYGDVRYYHDIEPFVKWCDVVFHLAAQIHVDKSITNPQETLDINVGGTLSILEAVRKYDKKMVFASSSEVYGSQQTADCMFEGHPLDSQSPYAASKAAGDRLCYSYWKTYGTKVAILRNFNTFGEYQNDTSYGGVIAIFARQTVKGDPLTVFGDGFQERDYMHVRDAVKGYELCLNKELWGKPINIGTGKTIKIINLAHKFETLGNSKVKYLPERPGEVQRLCADISFAKSLGFKPTTDFDKDLINYMRWYERNNVSTLPSKNS